MKQAAVVMAVISGLCFLPASFPYHYVIVEDEKNMMDAMAYCRNKYIDLAVVKNKEDLDKLTKLTGSSPYWIGLNRDTNAWTWSLEDAAYYGEGETKFTMWEDGYPYGQLYYKVCVMMAKNGNWKDELCYEEHDFICYNKSTEGTPETSPSFIHVNAQMTWDEAQAHCRKHYTDLASVRNQTENDQIMSMADDTWIGLYRNSWRWSDGSEDTFPNWSNRAPSYYIPASCAIVYNGKWENCNCKRARPFVCYTTETQVVKVVVKTANTSVNMEELGEEVLKRFYQGFKEQYLATNKVKLTWRKQPDGKIFHKKEEEASMEEEQNCSFIQF